MAWIVRIVYATAEDVKWQGVGMWTARSPSTCICGRMAGQRVRETCAPVGTREGGAVLRVSWNGDTASLLCVGASPAGARAFSRRESKLVLYLSRSVLMSAAAVAQ